MLTMRATPFAKLLLALAFLSCQTACTNDDSSADGGIRLTSAAAVELYPVVNQKATVTFTARDSWKASCTAAWVVCSPLEGSAGDNSVTLTTMSTNRTKATRSAQLVITSGTSRKTVTVVQSGKFAVFSGDEYTVDPEGGRLVIDFTSNLTESDQLQVGFNNESWINWAVESRVTRAEWQGSLSPLDVQPNTSVEGRTTAFMLVMGTNDGDWLPLDTCFVHQLGVVDNYVSTDYTADGTVTLLQQSTRGRGIPVVVMGDGFADRDIADSTYARVMEKTVDNLFSEEPAKSLRNYFDVYAVTAVSRNSGVGENRSTVFSTVPSVTSSEIACDDGRVEAYLRKIDGLDLDNTLAVVILNSHAHNGVTYLYNDDNNRLAQYALALCPVIDSLASETFRQVLTHEAIGHGLAKLADEYGYATNSVAPTDVVKQLDDYHRYGWMVNVDSNSDTQLVTWGSFIGDSRFAGEQIGVYEGGFTYMAGIYRPTDESMMRSNESPFNAPSRKAIYDKVMSLGEGRAASTLDEFADFDATHKPERWDYSTVATRSLTPWRRHRLAPPVMRQWLTR